MGQGLPGGVGRGEQFVRQTGLLPKAAAQLGVQKSQPEIRRCIPRQAGHTVCHLPGQLRAAYGGEQVQLHCGMLRPPLGSQQSGQLHDADAGEAVVRKLNFALLPGQQAAAVQQAGGGFGPDAGQLFAGVGGLQGGQAGVYGFHPAAALLGKTHPEPIGAELRPGGSAHCADHCIRVQGAGALLGVQLHSIAAPALGQGAHRAAGEQLHLPAFQLPLQQVYQVGSLVGVRVDPAGLVCPGHKPQAMEPAQRVGCIHSLQQPLQCGGVCGKIPLRADGEVVQIAAAVAGGQQLFSGPGVALGHRYLHSTGTGLGCRKGSGQSGGTAAQYKDLPQGRSPPFP